MGSVGSSDWEKELKGNPCISKRPKMPKKFSDDFIRVDYALVPRKLRSVKKRNSGSVSPQVHSCKKHNRVTSGDELSGKNGLKKLKLRMEHGVSIRPGTHGFGSTITKDEEEVAETLYALADMVPRTKLAGEPSKLESAAFSSMEISDSGAKVVMEKETENRTISNAGTEGSAEGVNIQSSSDGSWLESLVKNSLLNTDSEPRSVVPHQSTLEIGKNSGKASASVSVRGQHGLLHSPRESKNDGSSLWPGLTLKKSLHSEMQRPLLQSSNSKFSAISQPQHWENSVTPKKFQVALRKPWKKCCTHIHISNLINELKKADTLQMQPTPAHFQELNRGAFITSNTLAESSNNVFPLASTSNAVSSAADPKLDEIRNAVILHKRLLQDQKHTATVSQFFTLQNQNLDFFPLPAGSVDGSSHCSAKVDQHSGTAAELHLTYLHSKIEQTIPFHLPPNYYSTGRSGGGTAFAQQVQLQSSFGSSNYAQARGVTASPKQQPWQIRQQQNWCDQLTEQWKGGGISSSNIPNWQKSVQDGAPLLQYAPFFSASHSPLPVLGQNYTLRQQQQQPSSMPPLLLPSSREQGQTHLHYGLQGSGGCHPDTVQPALQLLCKQQL